MADFYDEDFYQSDKNYIETTNGPIHIHDIPYVTTEPIKYKFIKVCLFYGLFIVVFFMIIYTVFLNERKNKNMDCLHLNNIHAPSFKKIPASINMSKIRIFNFTESLPIEHIILIDINNDIIDIDVKYNYFIKTYKIGSDSLGELIEMDLSFSKSIKEIVLLVNPEKLFASNTKKLVTIELYNFDDKVWEFSSMIDQKENSFKIYKEAPITNVTKMDIHDGKNILISNDLLPIKLEEFTENYEY